MSAAQPVQSVGLFVLAFETLFAAFCQSFLRVEHGEGARRARAAARCADRPPDRNRQPPRVLRRRQRRCSSARSPTAARRRCCCSTSTASRRSTIRPGIRPGTLCSRRSRGWSQNRSTRAICSRGLAARNLPACWSSAPMAEALRIAERVRGRFEAMRFAELAGRHHCQRRRRHGGRHRPRSFGADGNCRPCALSRQGGRPQPRRAGAAGACRARRRHAPRRYSAVSSLRRLPVSRLPRRSPRHTRPIKCKTGRRPEGPSSRLDLLCAFVRQRNVPWQRPR